MRKGVFQGHFHRAEIVGIKLAKQDTVNHTLHRYPDLEGLHDPIRLGTIYSRRAKRAYLGMPTIFPLAASSQYQLIFTFAFRTRSSLVFAGLSIIEDMGMLRGGR